ncbi:hypothetical protein LUZ63_015552 [Rhynchospora breviuscula]|uniref:SWIM-type domain-containing protein n=1 Tax=Rhynchospora breviuscula TaxID=2022672 RepID=A0A9Q0CCI6_9POAL|nr:hypothetical protein LUZ63_015552 [Rhynchospora breviuscula]
MVNEGVENSIRQEHPDDIDSHDHLDCAPFVGKEFLSEDDAKAFYNNFAYRRGFSIRKGGHYISSKKEEATMVRFVCSSEGFANKPDNQTTPQKDKPHTRTGCKARLRIRLQDGIWKVSVFEDDHNHPLITSPAKKRGLRSHRELDPEDRQCIKDMHAQNIEPVKIHQFLVAKHGGMKNVKFKRKDVSNQIASENRRFVGVDVEATLVYFQKKKEEDSEFYYDVEIDEDGHLKNIFWVDGRARRACQEFGDVVTFDTTYQTNRYCMPLAPFIGVNHHWQNIYFGVAMLRSETKVSFVWLFETWVKAMYGKEPKTIITDQCPSMRIAIKEVFPNTVHRCCQWHVMRKASDHLGALYNLKDGFEDELKRVINCSMTVSEFEEGWRNMLVNHDLRNNRHLKNMYESRSEWVPAYFRDVFCANMSTSQRSESANASLKIWTNNHQSMYKLALHIEKIVEGIWARESDEDITTMKKVSKLSTLYLMEKDASQVYTAKIMSIFKENLKLSQLGEVNEVEKDMLYEVTIKEHPTIEKWREVTYMVKVDKSEEFVSCSCKGYEFDGLLCSHAIKIMHHVNLFHLPKRYIMKRWCKDANASVKRSHVERSMEFGSTQEQAAIRVATLKPRLMRILDIASMSSDAFIQFQGLLDMVEQQMQGHVVVAGEQEPITCEDATPSNGIMDPPISQCKGKRKQPQRYKPPSEAKKPRKCGICGSKKGGHNARTCPLKNSNGKVKASGPEDDYADSGPEDEEYEDLSS